MKKPLVQSSPVLLFQPLTDALLTCAANTIPNEMSPAQQAEQSDVFMCHPDAVLRKKEDAAASPAQRGSTNTRREDN